MRYSNALFIISAHSSGSSCSAIEVEPLTSQNKIVTMRRSPSTALDVRAASSFAATCLVMYFSTSDSREVEIGDWSLAEAAPETPSFGKACPPVPGALAACKLNPQLLQNFAPAGFTVLQLGQARCCGCPQLEQNFAPCGFSKPQFQHFMFSLL